MSAPPPGVERPLPDLEALREHFATVEHDAAQSARDSLNGGFGEDPDAQVEAEMAGAVLALLDALQERERDNRRLTQQLACVQVIARGDEPDTALETPAIGDVRRMADALRDAEQLLQRAQIDLCAWQGTADVEAEDTDRLVDDIGAYWLRRRARLLTPESPESRPGGPS